MNIRFGKENDTAKLEKLWLENFSDPERFVKWNFKYNYSPENVVLAEQNGGIASALHIIGYDLCFEGEDLKGAYISAVATKKNFRKRGYASEIVSAADEICKKRGYDLCFLVPDISGFYERFGYFFAAEKKEKIISADKAPEMPFEITELDNEKFYDIYNSFVKNKRFYLKRSKKNSEMVLEDHLKNTLGDAKMLSDGGGYILFGEEEGLIKIYELCAARRAAEQKLISYAASLKKNIKLETSPLMIKILNDKKSLLKLKEETVQNALSPDEIFFNLIL